MALYGGTRAAAIPGQPGSPAKLSEEENAYINSLPIAERPITIFGLQTENPYYLRNFVLFLRKRG